MHLHLQYSTSLGTTPKRGKRIGALRTRAPLPHQPVSQPVMSNLLCSIPLLRFNRRFLPEPRQILASMREVLRTHRLTAPC
ncbi:hypothetical protein O988_09120 [Pseudogymnoascus sp. VKM F-3808]|nr:hypothetical protein O988_09120 [Pseudogymnoascus sp. VKM F-3808]